MTVTDIFATLPPELIAPILAELPDLRDLYAITLSSPYVFHFMSSRLGIDVLQTILQRPSFPDIRLASWIPYLLGLVALVRQSPSSLGDGVASFIATYIMPTVNQNQLGEQVPELRCCPPDSLPKIRLRDVMKGEPHAFTPREMLFLVWRIDKLAAACFNFFLHRMKDTRPQHLVDKTFSLSRLPWDRRPDGRSWGESYAIDVGGEASWYEMQRLTLGFWTLQLCYELSNAASEGRLKWSDTDVDAVRAMGSGMCMPGVGKSSLWIAREPLWAAFIYVQHLEGREEEMSCVGDTDVSNNGYSVFFNTGFKPLGDKYPLRLPSPRPETSAPRLDWPPAIPPPPPFSCKNEQDAFTYHCHKALLGCKGLRWAGPILCPRGLVRLTEGLLFRPFRRLGFGIWDDERLIRMEMLDDPMRRREGRFSVWCQDQMFTWTSLLRPEEMEELRRHQAARAVGEILGG
ncbi:hypothetical protein ACJ41O_001309 [Fusarium nematophilum]